MHEPGGTCPLLRQDDTGVHYILPDQNDGPSEEVDAAGGAVGWQAMKGTWAEGWRHHGYAGGEPFLGQWFDAESGLHYNRFRYYDPETGRYISPDPIGIIGGLNEYLGTTAPLTRRDRLGLTPGDCGDEVDLTGDRKDHILNRHRNGAGKPEKTEFPAGWGDSKILHAVSDVATDPGSRQGTGKWNPPFVEGEREGIIIHVDFYPPDHAKAGQISTAYPTNTPPNPPKPPKPPT